MKSQGVAPGGSASAGATPAAAAAAPAAPASVGEGLLVTREDNMTIIKLNRPAKKNAITTQVSISPNHFHQFLCSHLRLITRSFIQKLLYDFTYLRCFSPEQMYNDISSALEEAGKDDSTLTVVTGRY